MRIGVDIRVLSRGVRTGVEEYTLNLLSHLLKLNQSDDYFLFYNAYRKIVLNYDWLKFKKVYLKQFQIPNRLLFTSARYFNLPKIDKLLGGTDVYFNPHFFNAPVSKKCSKIITFHDLSFERYPDFFSFKKKNWHNLLIKPYREAKQSKTIIAVSQSTKEDLVELYKISPKKIKVVYPGVNILANSPEKQNRQNIRDRYCLPEKFILYFGTIEPRKNLIGLIKSFENLKYSYDKSNEYKLVIAGSLGWLYKDIIKTAKNSRFSKDIIFTGYIQEKDKLCLYGLAELFVYPSFFEGFGFPPLEAMASGLPVIVANSSSLPEVVGKAALMINPYNIDEITWAMQEVLDNSSLRQNLIERGYQRAKQFSWRKSAQEVSEILHNS